MKTFRNTLWAVVVGLAASAGCAPAEGEWEGDDFAEGDGVIDETKSATSSTNGLTAINGLSSFNGLSSYNGLSTFNGLSSYNGLSSFNGLMTYDGGRKTVEYLVRCALRSGDYIDKKDQYGRNHRFYGQLGLAPEWKNYSCGLACQEYISSCLMAHVNTAGQHIPLWLDAQHPAIGWGRSSSYPNMEGSFFGNLFVSPPTAFFCHGRGFATNVVPGRIGASQTNAPYKNPAGATAYCDTFCTRADIPYQNDGFKACHGFNNILTVWRK